MHKRCVIIDRSVSSDDLLPPVDWNVCVLCQQQTRECLVDPSNSLRKGNDIGYESLANILPEFHKLGELPRHLVLSSIDNGCELTAALKTKSAKWHKSCRAAFSERELVRKTANAKKRLASEALCSEGSSNGTEIDHDEVLIDRKKVCTRSECDSENTLRAKIPTCFFCDLPAGSHNLHDVTTLAMGEKVEECALVLSDNRLLAKLAVGDMIAVEAKYHLHCLAKLYNLRRVMASC